jgi:alpha-mannosidase
MPGAGPRFGDEVPRAIWQGWRQIQDWVSADASDWGVTISADHQFFTVTPSAIRGGMLRGTRFNPLNIVHEGKPVLLQQPPAGTYTYRYSFTSGRGDWSARRAWQSGMQFTMPPIPVEAANDVIGKTLPAERSFLSLDAPDVVVTALKKSDRGNALVLRAFDERGKPIETPVHFLGNETAFRPANMLEEETTKADLKRLQFKPFEIQTVRIPLP